MRVVALVTIICAVVLVGCCSLEMGLVIALVGAAVCLNMTCGDNCGRDGGDGINASCMSSSKPVAPGASSARRSSTTRAARMASNVQENQKTLPRRRPIVREPLVERTPLAPIMESHPTENVLDACMLEAQQKRNRSLDARHYHTHALPNAIRVAAMELTTADPAIVPLDFSETCVHHRGKI